MKARLDALRAKMKERQLDAVLISHPSNRRYITGFTGSSGYALVTLQEAIFLTDFRYIKQAEEEAAHFKIVRHGRQAFDTLSETCRELGLSSLAFEQDHLTYGQVEKLREALDGLSIVPISSLIESLRMVKDEQELAVLRQAVAIVDEVFNRIIQEIRPGIQEREIAIRMEAMMRELGASGSAFDIIVASGPRSALPHGVASERVLEKGDLVTLDFGAVYQGYCSDLTRTVMLGEPSPKQREIYEIVKEAQQAAVDGIRPGITGREADAVARERIAAAGYGDYFGHGTGHGIGLDVHESPTVSPFGEQVLVPGMVVTVEPGIYLPDFGGVRIEDDVVVTENGHEVLTQSSKELIIL